MKTVRVALIVGSMLFLTAIQHANLMAQTSAETKTPEAPKVVSPPSCRSCPQPDFLSEARKAKVSSALVMLDVLISVDGQAEDIRVVSDPGHGLAENAVKAVKKWKFRPAAAKDGKKVPIRIKIEVKFWEEL